MNTVRQSNIGGPVVSAVAGPLQRAQLREASLPIAQDMLRDAEFVGQLPNGLEGLVAFLRSLGHPSLSRR